MKFWFHGYTSHKPYSRTLVVWLFVFCSPVMLFLHSCEKESEINQSFLTLKTGVSYTSSGAVIPVGGTIRIGILASGAGEPLTYLRIDRITGNDTTTQVDRGLYITAEGLDEDFTFSKDTSAIELWIVTVMNADRDTAVRQLTVYRGSGSAYGPVDHFDSITVGLQANNSLGHFLDVHTGMVYNDASIAGHESEIDIVCYFYFTSGLPSPTFTCPGYVSAVGYYPEIAGWSGKNSILYDYYSSDNDLVSIEQFESAQNDSLLVTAFKPEHVSGNCKYGYTGKVIPFKTDEGKYGLIRVRYADEDAGGRIDMEIKIQK